MKDDRRRKTSVFDRLGPVPGSGVQKTKPQCDKTNSYIEQAKKAARKERFKTGGRPRVQPPSRIELQRKYKTGRLNGKELEYIVYYCCNAIPELDSKIKLVSGDAPFTDLYQPGPGNGAIGGFTIEVKMMDSSRAVPINPSAADAIESGSLPRGGRVIAINPATMEFEVHANSGSFDFVGRAADGRDLIRMKGTPMHQGCLEKELMDTR